MRNRKELSVLVMMVLMLLVSCGGGKGAANPGSLDPRAGEAGYGFPEDVTGDDAARASEDIASLRPGAGLPGEHGRRLSLDEARQEIAALVTPSEVEQQDFAELQRELSRLLDERAARDMIRTAQAAGDSPSRSISIPQQDARDRVTLSYANGYLNWWYRSTGDYDQNGEVNAADLIPLAILLGTGGGPFEDYTTESVVDGDGNGEINIADVAPIAQHFGVRITQYAVYASGSQADHPGDDALAANGPGTIELGRVDQADTLPVPGIVGRKQYGFELQQQRGMNYWVRPLDGEEAGIASGIVSGGGWFMAGVDACNSGQSPFRGPAETSLLWSLELPDGRASGLTAGSDGLLYFNDTEGTIRAVNSTGATVWQYESNDGSISAPAVDEAGNVVVSGDGYVYKIDNQGELQWKAFLSIHFREELIVCKSGLVVVYLSNGKLEAITADGQPAWSYELLARDDIRPASGPEGNIYVCSGQGLRAFSQKGELLWYISEMPEATTSPAVGPGGVVYVGSSDNRIIAIDPHGEQLWDFSTHAKPDEELAVSRDGRILFVTEDSRLYCLSPAGALLWSRAIAGNISSPPLLDSEGSIYLCRQGRGILKLDRDGGQLWQLQEYDRTFTPAICADGSLVFSDQSAEWTVISIGSPVQGLQAGDGLNPGTIEVSWQPWPGADWYLLQYRNYEGAEPYQWTELATLDGEHGTKLQHSAQSGTGILCAVNTAYEYRVTALKGGSMLQTWSNTDTGFRRDPTAPMMAWPNYGYNASGSRRSPASGPDLVDMDWYYGGTSGPPASACVIDDKGRIYLSIGGTLHCVGQDGERIWSRELNCHSHAVPSVASDGSILVSTDDNQLLALSPEGDQLWSFSSPVEQRYVATTSSRGRIHVYGTEKEVFSLDNDGTLLWKYEGPGYPQYPLRERDDGVLLFIASQAGLVACSADGEIEWINSIQIPGYNSLRFGPDGIAYVSDYNGMMHLIGRDGQDLAEINIPSFPYEPLSFLVGADGAMYLLVQSSSGGGPSRLVALEKSGNERWRLELNGSSYLVPLLDGRGVLYTIVNGESGADDHILAVNPDGSIRWTYNNWGISNLGSLVMDADGALYAGNYRGVMRLATPQGGQQ